MTNQTLMAVPLFVLMGVILERSKIAEDLLDAMTGAFGRAPGGLGLAVCLVGMLMAASTGIVGATVVTMGLMALPTMLKAGTCPKAGNRHHLRNRHPRPNYSAFYRIGFTGRRHRECVPAVSALARHL